MALNTIVWPCGNNNELNIFDGEHMRRLCMRPFALAVTAAGGACACKHQLQAGWRGML